MPARSDVLLVSMPPPDHERLEWLTESIAKLIRRQEEFEKRLALLEDKSPLSQPAQAARTPAAPAIPRPVSQQKISQALPRPKEVALETKVGLTLINRIGVVTLVLGVGFFFKWAVDNNWVGPTGRIMLGVAAGLITLGAADVLWRNGQAAFAQGMTGSGIAVLYLAVYSGYGFYHLIPQTVAFVLMCCITSLAFALSLRYASSAVTALGLFGGFLTPILLSSGEDHPWFLFSYVLLLDATAMALAKKRNWRLLEVMSAIAKMLIYAAWLTKIPIQTDRFPATVALLTFYALYSRISQPILFLGVQVLAALAVVDIAQGAPTMFFLLSLLLAAGGLAYAERNRLSNMLSGAFGSFWISYFLYRVSQGAHELRPQLLGLTGAFVLFLVWNCWVLARKREQPVAQRLSVIALNGIVFYAATYTLLHGTFHAWLGLLAMAVAGAYFAFGAFVYRKRDASGQSQALFLSLGMAVAFVTLAIPIQFTAFTITVAWSFEAAALSWIASRLRNERAALIGIFIFVLVAVRLLLIDDVMLPDARTYALLWNARFFTFAVASISLFLGARWSIPLSPTLVVWEYFGGHVVLLWALSLEAVAWAQRSMPPLNILSAETLSLSILYGFYALVLISAGVATRTAMNRIAGLILILVVIAKLYLFDIWQLQRPYRISAFIALGILLISTSFLYSRFRPLIESLLREDETSA